MTQATEGAVEEFRLAFLRAGGPVGAEDDAIRAGLEAAGSLTGLLGDLAGEVERQDRFHPSGYPATRDGVFLGIKTAAHELDVEAIGAWRGDRCRCETPLCGHATWAGTRGELLQAAAVIIRTIRSIDNNQATTAAISLGVHPR